MLWPSFRCFPILLVAVILAQSQASHPVLDGPRPPRARVDTAANLPTETKGLQVPLLGYLASESPVSVRPILGAPGAVVVGDPIPLPRGVTRCLPAPGQKYGLVERSGAGELGVLQFGVTSSGSVQSIPNTLAHADRVSFSPSGTVALIYSAKLQRAQVVNGLPSSPQITQSLDLTTIGLPVTSLAVSDDAQSVLAGVSDGTNGAVWLFADDQPARHLINVGIPSALRFFAGNQDAVVADSGWRQVSLLRTPRQDLKSRLLADAALGITVPTDLDISSDDEHVLVADASANLISINLNTLSTLSVASHFAPARLDRLATHSVYLVTSLEGTRVELWTPGGSSPNVWGLPRQQNEKEQSHVVRRPYRP